MISKKRTSRFRKQLSISRAMKLEINNVVSWKLCRTFWYKYVRYDGLRETSKYKHQNTRHHVVLQCARQPATSPYPEPDESILSHPKRFILSNILLPSVPSFSKWSLSCSFFTETILSYPPYAIYSSKFILFDLNTCMIFCEDYRF